MKLYRKIAALLAVCAFAATAPVAAFPDKPLRVVIPYPAGGTTDVLGRMLQASASAAAGQPIVIDNRPGGASVIGTSSVARAPADGTTLLLADLALLVNPSLIKDIPYNTTKDFRAVVGLAKAPLVLLVHPSVPANTLQELMALGKAKPGSLNYGSGGYGGSTHMASEMFRMSTGLDVMHVPYQGVAPAMNAVLGGQVQIYFGGTTTAQTYVASGKLKALAVTGTKRSPLLPTVPTFSELGVQGMNADTYWGLYVPAATDDAKVQKLNEVFRKAMADPAVVARANELGLELLPNTVQEQQKTFIEMVSYWATFIKKTGIKVD